ncbi:MAG: hypothetical protein H6572_01605 [Lewinellaceae bacterium]|nr:hypothetical protein [Lewinellaceae bacterium]
MPVIVVIRMVATKHYRHIIATILLLCLYCNTSLGQNKSINGRISYLSSTNVYVKFQSTEGILSGDTLYINSNGISTACLLVQQKSSISCVCTAVNSCQPELNQEVLAILNTKIQIEATDNDLDSKKDNNVFPKSNVDTLNQSTKSQSIEKVSPAKQKIRGNFSIYSTNSLSDSRKYGNIRYRLAFNGNNLNDSPLSISSYLMYRQYTFDDRENSLNNLNYFRIYDLALNYQLKNTSMTFGRKINPRMSSIGAIDGLQINHRLGRFEFGGIAGTRPDRLDYGINLDLVQYGLYLGYGSQRGEAYHQSTLGLMEQTNNGSTDRRFIYFQHSNSAIDKNLNIFISAEMDLYEKINDTIASKFELTNFYSSARYRISKKMSFSVSYDNRKNIIYYETDKSYVERLLEDEARQGLRFSLQLSPLKYVSSGISYSKRFQTSGQNQSDNYNIYVTHSRLPGLEALLSLRWNYNVSNYQKSNILNIRMAKDFFKGKLFAEIFARKSQYTYGQNYDFSDKSLGLDLGIRISRKLLFYSNIEKYFSSNHQTTLNFRLRQRI